MSSPAEPTDASGVDAGVVAGPPGGDGASVARGPVLEARGLSAGYGPQPVIHDIDLEVRPGEVVGLLGANGAGKTTTLLTLAGELPPLRGDVMLDGQVTRAPLHRRARMGLQFVTEERSVFKGLTRWPGWTSPPPSSCSRSWTGA
jgi:branched-chain amino acid transport system ATP-binding protein